MDKYIIQYTMRINGVNGQITYHETIKESTRLDTNNVYVEHLTTERKLAKRFYDIEEAEAVAKMFTRSYQKSTILTVKK